MRVILLIAGPGLLFSGCREVFYPEIGHAGPLVAVEGLITDGPGPHFIRLSHTTGYYSGTFGEPLEGASVRVRMEGNDSVLFNEVRPGVYQSPDGFQGSPGNTYILEFETPDGTSYHSSPQLMHQPFTPGALHAAEAVRTSVRESNSGQLIVTEKSGVEASLQLVNHAGNPANIRFKSDVKVLYVYETFPPSGPQRHYCWRELRRFEGLEHINLPATGNLPGDVSDNVVAFLPDDKEEYFVGYFDFLQTLAVKVRTYSLNEDAYNYYLDVYKQLTSDGTLFAPIPSQLSTNIFCVTDPQRPAVGLFEVSATASGAYILRKPPEVPSLMFEPTSKYDEVPSVPGCSENEPPPFWFY